MLRNWTPANRAALDVVRKQTIYMQASPTANYVEDAMHISKTFPQKKPKPKQNKQALLPGAGCYWLCGQNSDCGPHACDFLESERMKISEAFSGNYLKAADLPQPKVLTVQTVVQESIGEQKETKLVVRFHGEQRGLVLNKVNALEVSTWYGDDTARWTNQPVELFSTTTFFSGRQVPCIRVRRPAVPQQLPVPSSPQVHPAHYQAAAPVPQYAPVPQPVAAVQPSIQAPTVPFDA